MKNFYFILLWILVFLNLKPSNSFGGLGHAITGAISFQLLAPEEQSFYQSILDYMSEKHEFIEVFSEAARWADDIRWSTRRYDYWHYIQNCWASDKLAKCRKLRKPNSFTVFNDSINTFLDPQATEAEKGFYFLFLLHIIGDIHQPLHNINMYNENYTRGDSAGNAVDVQYNDDTGNLHQFWDNLCTLNPQNPSRSKKLKEKSRLAMDQLALEYIANYTFPKEEIDFSGDLSTVENWINQGVKIAIEHAYTPSVVQEGKISDDYAKNCKNIIDVQLAKGGRRIASVLKYLFEKRNRRNDGLN